MQVLIIDAAQKHEHAYNVTLTKAQSIVGFTFVGNVLKLVVEDTDPTCDAPASRKVDVMVVTDGCALPSLKENSDDLGSVNGKYLGCQYVDGQVLSVYVYDPMYSLSLHVMEGGYLPQRKTEGAGGFDVYMPTDGTIPVAGTLKVGLRIKAQIPKGYIALMLPRSSNDNMLVNTVGLIDDDFRGEWFVNIYSRNGTSWKRGDRVFQFTIVPRYSGSYLSCSEHFLDVTERGTTNGSTGVGVE